MFIQKYFENKVPEARCSLSISQGLEKLFPKAGALIEHGNFKEALDTIFAFVRTANKYFDEEQPWVTIKSNVEKCKETLNTCIQIIANLSLLLEPFLPFSSAKVRKMLKIEKAVWQKIEIAAGLDLGAVEILFERIDKKAILEEEEKLASQVRNQ